MVVRHPPHKICHSARWCTQRTHGHAVCRSWHLSSRQNSLSPPSPWLALPDGTFFSLPNNESLQFPNSVGYHSSSGEWLVFLDDGNCSLVNPFSKVTLMLPKLSCVNSIVEPTEVINGPLVQSFNPITICLSMLSGISIQKVIVCSPVLVAAIYVIGDIHTVALCRPGAPSWFVSAVGNGMDIMDIMFYEGKLFVVTYRDLFSMKFEEDDDDNEPKVSQIELLIEDSDSLAISPNMYELSHYLVESCGVLLLVRREAQFKRSYPSDTNGLHVMVLDINFMVFEADLGSSQWVTVKSVGDDMALFLSKGCSRAVSVSQYKQWGNCIFFLDDETWGWFWKEDKRSCLKWKLLLHEERGEPEYMLEKLKAWFQTYKET
ncbi:hypothetical protein ACP4OV_029536 [Aristida adscensionis]